MRLPVSIAILSSACAAVVLSGCAPGTIDSGSHTSASTSQIHTQSNTATKGQGGTAGQTSTTTDRSVATRIPGSQTPGESIGSTSSGTAGNGSIGSSSTGSSGTGSTFETKSGLNNSSTMRTAEDFSLVTTGTLSNVMEAKFAPAAWNGLGEAALLVTPLGSIGLNGNLLYILTDSKHSATGHSQAILLAEHATSALFSKDGKWLAVETQTNQGTPDTPSEDSHLWLMSADGKTREDMGSVPYVQGDWVGHETFVYTVGGSQVYTVQPGHKPATLPLKVPKGTTINAMRVNPKTGLIAVDEVVPDGNQNIVDRHDVIALWNPKTGNTKTLLTASKGDGFILGPWTADGSRLFYWGDPMHSGSIAADGLQLRLVGADGKTQPVGVTLTGLDAVKPVGTNRAVIQVGGSRYLFVQKQVELWNGSKLTSLHGNGTNPADKAVTEVWPTVSPNQTHVAFSEGPVLPAMASQEQATHWWEQLQLVVGNLSDGSRTVVSAAGKGIIQPNFTADGQHITYISGSQFDVVSLKGSKGKQIVFAVSPTNSASYPQWSLGLPVQMVDYRP